MKKRLSLLLTMVFVLVMSVNVIAAPSYTDIENHWAKDPILNMTERGILSGYEDNTFRPDNDITRAEFAKVLYSATERKPANVENPFSDVAKSWYYEPVLTLYHDGIITGTSKTTFEPNAPITREQMITMIYRVQKEYNCFDLTLDKSKDLSAFKDEATISSYAKEAVLYGYQADIVNGIDGNIAPKLTAKRCQVAQILYACLTAVKTLPTEISQADWDAAKKFVKLSTGITMAYIEMGNPQGEPLILLHGTTDSSRCWSVTAKKLSADFHIYIPDQRGSGLTDAPDHAAYTLSEFAEDIRQFMDEVGLESANVAGHSLGSRIAACFGANYPDMVDRLALLGTGIQVASPPGPNSALYNSPEFDEIRKTPEFLDNWDFVTPGILDGKAYKEEVEEMVSYIKEDTKKISLYAFTATERMRAIDTLTHIYKDITAPTAIFQGGNDGPGRAGEVAKLLPDYKGIVVYEGCGHSIEWEVPYELAEDMTLFFTDKENPNMSPEIPDPDPAPAKDLPTEISQADWVKNKQYVQLATGIKMAYVEMGQPDGEDLILVHGMTDSSRTWSIFATYLAEKYHIYIIDNMGHGDSSAPENRVYDLWDHAANLNAFMDAMGLEKADLVGHSMGSGTVQAFAINYPERVAKMAVFGTHLPKAGDRSSYDWFSSPDFDPKDPEFLAMWDGNPEGPYPMDEELQQYVMEDAGNIPLSAWKAIAKGVSVSDLSAYYADITRDYLIVWGNLDGERESQDEILALTPQATFVIYDQVGHNIQWQRPEALAQDIDAYFTTGTPISPVTEHNAE